MELIFPFLFLSLVSRLHPECPLLTSHLNFPLYSSILFLSIFNSISIRRRFSFLSIFLFFYTFHYHDCRLKIGKTTRYIRSLTCLNILIFFFLPKYLSSIFFPHISIHRKGRGIKAWDDWTTRFTSRVHPSLTSEPNAWRRDVRRCNVGWGGDGPFSEDRWQRTPPFFALGIILWGWCAMCRREGNLMLV